MEITIIFSIAILVISVVLHEVAHGFTAYLLGDPTAKLAGRLTLNPVKHLDIFGSLVVPFLLSLFPGGFIVGWAKPVPYNPHMLQGGKYGPAMVAMAGPAMNFLLAIVFAFLARSSTLLELGGISMVSLCGSIVLINIALGIFNLTPVAPFDGSKILFAFLPRSLKGVQNFLEQNQLWLVLIVILIMSSMIDSVTVMVSRFLLGA